MEFLEKQEFATITSYASYDIVVHNNITSRPEKYGTGCIIRYGKQLIFLTAGHVVNPSNCSVLINNYIKNDSLQTQFHDLGEISFVQEPLIESIADFKKSLNSTGINLDDFQLDQIDLGYKYISTTLSIIQPEMNYDSIKIRSGSKIVLDLNLDYMLSSELNYGLSGKIKHNYNGFRIDSEKIMILDLKYLSTNGFLLCFKKRTLIQDKSEFEGCSGAPVIDNMGNFIGILLSCLPNSKLVFALSGQAIIEIIEKYSILE